MERYNELLEFDICGAILYRSDQLGDISEVADEIMSKKIVSEEFIDEHLETIFLCHGHHHFQDYDFHMKVFKKIINKYDMTEDYEKYHESHKRMFNMKWSSFCTDLIKFITSSGQELRIKLFESNEIKTYLNKFHNAFSYFDRLYRLEGLPLKALLSLPSYQKELINAKQYKINEKLIKEGLGTISLPQELLYNLKFIKKLAYNLDTEEYNRALKQLRIHNNTDLIEKEHAKFCDSIIKQAKKKETYFTLLKDRKWNEEIQSHMALSTVYDAAIDKYGKENTEAAREYLSKYIIATLICSKHFKATPYNLLTDMNNLNEYIKDPLRQKEFEFPNYEIYHQLANYKESSFKELCNLYESLKDINISEEFYDDWHKAQLEFVNDFNSRRLRLKDLKLYKEVENGKTTTKIYELKDQDYYIVTRNTSIDLIFSSAKEELKKQIEILPYMSLSIQDEKHLEYYVKEGFRGDIRTDLKLVYSSLNENRIGMVFHQDAYTYSITKSETGSGVTRKIYPLKRLMDKTNIFNDLTYVNDGTLKQIAIMCDTEVTREYLTAAAELNLPVIKRDAEGYKKNTEIKNPTREGREYLNSYYGSQFVLKKI